MNTHLLEILVCPVCKSKLHVQNNQLICKADKLVFAIRDGIPILLENEASPWANS